MLLYWAFLQLVSGLFTGVSGAQGASPLWAHIGGFVAGLLLVGLFPAARSRRRASIEPVEAQPGPMGLVPVHLITA